MKIWLVNPFDPMPSQQRLRYSYLIGVLCGAGHDVTWWTSAFAHYGKRYITQDDIDRENRALAGRGRIVPCWTTRYRAHVGPARFINHAIWAGTLSVAARRSGERPDVVVISSPPLLAASQALRFARRLGAASVLDVVDLWPEAFDVALPARIRPLARACFAPLKALEGQNFRRADAIAAVSDTYRRVALERGGEKPSLTVPYGLDLNHTADEELMDPGADGTVRVCYAGMLGAQHDVEGIVRAAALLQHHPKLEIVIAGDGPDRARLEASVRAARLTNVHFTGWLQPADLRRLLASSVIGIAAIQEHSVITTPMKVFEYWAAGLAVVHSVEGEMRQLVDRHQVGLHYAAGSPDDLARAIAVLIADREQLRQMRHRARALVRDEFDREMLHRRFADFISDVASRRSGRASSAAVREIAS